MNRIVRTFLVFQPTNPSPGTGYFRHHLGLGPLHFVLVRNRPLLSYMKRHNNLFHFSFHRLEGQIYITFRFRSLFLNVDWIQ